MLGGRSTFVERATEALEAAIRNRDITVANDYTLQQHMLNARRRFSHGQLTLGKENDYTLRKIDAAVAAILAFQCRLDAVAVGATARQEMYVPKRLY